MRSVGSHSTSGREKEGNKERTQWHRIADYEVKHIGEFSVGMRFFLSFLNSFKLMKSQQDVIAVIVETTAFPPH